MGDTFRDLLNNAALLLALGVVYGAIQRRTETLGRKITGGIMLGLAAIVVMLNPWKLMPGIIFDTRPVVLSVGGMFLGVIPALIAAVIAGLFRIHIGGAGTLTGCLWVATSSAWGLGWLRLRKRSAWQFSGGEFYLLGFTLSVILLLLMFTMPDNMGPAILEKISLPILIIFPLATVLLAWLFSTYDLHRQHHRRIEENERKYKQLVEEARVIILRVDLEGKLLFINDYGQTFFGFSADELQGRSLVGSIIPEADATRRDFSSRLNTFHNGAADHDEFELEAVDKTGRQYTIEWKIAPLCDDHDKLSSLQFIGQDTTEKRVRQAQAIRTAQLASLGELSAGVAHEINNPVSGVINYAIVLKAQVQDAQVLATLDRIISEGQRIAKTVKTLLAFSREEKRAFQAHSIRVLLDDTLSLMLAQLKQDGIHVDVEMPESPRKIFCNAHQIEQVLLNFFSNARHTLKRKYPHASERKRIAIVVRDEETNFVRLDFTDYGEGIPEDLRARIFTPFFTTKEPGEGTGLGLGICHDIIELHHGTLHVESVPGEYTTFSIRVPCAT